MTDLHNLPAVAPMFDPGTRLEVVWFFLPALWAEYRSAIVAVSVVTAVLVLAVVVVVNALTRRLFASAALPNEPEPGDDPEATVEVRAGRRRPPGTGTICAANMSLPDPSEQTVVIDLGVRR
jgi:hypothetical protein